MGCFAPKDPVLVEQKNRSRELERKLKNWHRDYHEAIKLLLLGTGESGKTTIIKQMKILHMQGFSESDRKEKAVDIRQNIHESIYDLITNMSTLSPPVTFANEESEISASYIHNLGANEPSSYTQEYYDHVQTVWNDSGMKECYRRSNEFQLIDSAKYFLDRIEEIRNPDYSPSDQDILHCRKKTTGIQKIEFTYKVPFWMFDVGGQRGERRKWLPVFEGIHGVFFIVSSSDFNLTLREETSVNRLRESVNVFEDVWNSRFLLDAGIIVFLNKQDVLKEKLQNGQSIALYFPEYNKYQMSSKDGDGSDEYIRTRCFIRSLFVDVTKRRQRSAEDGKRSTYPMSQMGFADTSKRDCYYHFTTATDTGNIKVVYDDVVSIILNKTMSEIGFN